MHVQSDEELTFDVETAIKVCRNAGYFQHAVYLAEKYEEHDWYIFVYVIDFYATFSYCVTIFIRYLRIQLDDLGNYNDALAYINRLPSDMVRCRFLLYFFLLVW